MTTTQPSERVQRIAEQMRQTAARHPSMTGLEEVFAVGRIKSALADTYISDAERVAEIRDVVAAVDLANEIRRAELTAELAAVRAAQREETVTEDCHRCRHWTPAQRKWHHCIHCDGTGQVPAQQEESAR